MNRPLLYPLLVTLVACLLPTLAFAQQGSMWLTFDEGNPNDTSRTVGDFEIITFYLVMDTNQSSGEMFEGFEASVSIPPNLLVLSRLLPPFSINLYSPDDNFFVGFPAQSYTGPITVVQYDAVVTGPGPGAITLGPASPSSFPGNDPGWWAPSIGGTPFADWTGSELLFDREPPPPDPEIEYQFTATVTQANLGSGYSVGTEFTGTANWNPESAVTNPDPFSNGNATEYGPGEVVVTGLGTLDGTYGGSGNIRVVNDNVNEGTPNDRFFLESFGGVNPLSIDLAEIGGTLWNTQSISTVSPALGPVSQFDFAVIKIGNGLNEMTAIITEFTLPPGPTIYVKQSAPGGGDGSSWATAFNDLSLALDAAEQSIEPNEIWVAGGMYFPASVPDRNATFALHHNVMLYGGFNGMEMLREERDPTANLTFLNGDLGIPEDPSDNSYHVVSCVAPDEFTPLVASIDGFVITGANSVGQPDTARGGGIRLEYGSLTGRNLQLVDNQAQYGGGIANQFGELRLENVEIRGNNAVRAGGMNGRFSTNTLVNVVVEGNTADFYGGIGLIVSNMDLAHTTIANNSANTVIGGFAAEIDCVVTSRNTILWGNSAPSFPHVYITNGSTLDAAHSLFEGSGGSGPGWDPAYGSDGGNNLDADPLFVNPLFGDVHLQAGSPAIDAGDGNIPNVPGTDLAGNPRPLGLAVDMGPYEFMPMPTGVGDAPNRAPARTALHAPYPNPFNPRATVSFSLSQSGRTSVDIYDVRGRRVKTLLDEEMPAGSHQVVWSGRDQQGRGVASGVYLVQFRSAGVQEVRRVTLVK